VSGKSVVFAQNTGETVAPHPVNSHYSIYNITLLASIVSEGAKRYLSDYPWRQFSTPPENSASPLDIGALHRLNGFEKGTGPPSSPITLELRTVSAATSRAQPETIPLHPAFDDAT
jgi:hypothetical protein